MRVVRRAGETLGGLIPVAVLVAGLGCRRDGPPGRSPEPGAPTANAPTAAGSPAAERWDGFVAYPGARRLCTQHVDGFTGADRKQTVHFTWSAYVTADSREDVLAFYETAHRSLGPETSGGRFRLRTPEGANLNVYTVGSGDYPRCPDAPRDGERTVIIVGGPRTPTRM